MTTTSDRQLLDDAAVRDFITDGYLIIQSHHPPEFHLAVCRQLDEVLDKGGNPGNNLLPLVPGIQQVFDSPPVSGALESLLGPGFSMHPHRYCHTHPAGSKDQNWHKDDYIYDQNVRHHRFRWLMAFYYPQDVTCDMGPSAVMPRRQHYNQTSDTDPSRATEEEFKLTAPAGSVILLNFDAWHRATANTSDRMRYMLKFQFLRMTEPLAPSWDCAELDWQPDAGAPDGAIARHVWDWLAAREVHPDCGGAGGDLAALSHEDEDQRLRAAYTLSANGETAALIAALCAQAPALAEANQAKSPAHVQGGNPSEISAAYALAALADTAVPDLVAALNHDQWSVRAAAADVLGDIGRPSLPAAGALAGAHSDDSFWVRRNAAEALGTVAPGDHGTVTALAAALADEDHRIRLNATLALAKIGPEADAAVASLKPLLGDKSRYVRHNAMLALQRIDTHAARSVLYHELTTSRWCALTTAERPY